VAGEVARLVDIAANEEDVDLGALLGHSEKAAVLRAAAERAGRIGPRTRGLDEAGHREADAAELLGVVAIDHDALVDVRELRVVAVEIVIVKARHAFFLLFTPVREHDAFRLRDDKANGLQSV
jgi:hypothetical protein